MKFLIGLFLCSIFVSCSSQKSDEQNETFILLSKNGYQSISVVDIQTGKVIVADNQNQRLTPASLTKLFTSSSALEILGAEFCFNTHLYFSKQDQVLYVQGAGDPTLGSARFEETVPGNLFRKLSNELIRNGIKSIDGDIIIDCSRYNGLVYPSKRIWEDMANYYGAVPSALSYKENTFAMTLRSSNVGEKCQIVNLEPNPGVEFQCNVFGANNKKDSAYIYGHPNMGEWYVSGTIPANRKAFKIKGVLPNPAFTFGQDLKTYLNDNGIDVMGRVRVVNNKVLSGNEDIIYTHNSPGLNKIIGVVNQNSNNLYADHLLFELGQSSKLANWDEGTHLLNSYWQARLPGFKAQFYDGSGLSPFNKFSANDMVSLLIYMDKSNASVDFRKSLSVSGEKGTLKRFLKEEKAGSVIGKSGSMTGVLGYSGYLQTDSGRELAFCVLVNNFTEPFSEIRANIESLLSELIHEN
ncbi:D-alanyl-D-alanine carboxypeptidase/D-alanyl-D-alanine endopeptidase [Carboxylicivirga sp. N1Y90]|uniref:D-alanyl-D-alanine carboxypeptidase/D-alanyl-D-alanine endopeptidase n=1 Tax=Carboxylicivirga fragile TaxID=3417571 RepID=UPI003D33F475|nr:D-alanyl-D-alanine carboxypeptidase/D-alanyl-D-alanine-endopeptidase [Marinilabiliaceae bacterium N1Y90]